MIKTRTTGGCHSLIRVRVFRTSRVDAAAGHVVVGSDRLQLILDDQALFDDVNPYAPDGGLGVGLGQRAADQPQTRRTSAVRA